MSHDSCVGMMCFNKRMEFIEIMYIFLQIPIRELSSNLSAPCAGSRALKVAEMDSTKKIKDPSTPFFSEVDLEKK